MNIKAIGLVAIGSAALAGCATNPLFEEPGDARFGEANRQTMMAQVVNPDPVYDEEMVTSGEQAANAIERYRTDSVKQPDNISTTEGASGNNNSSNSGSSGPN